MTAVSYPLPLLQKRTELEPLTATPLLSHLEEGIVGLGSCFSQAMLRHLAEAGFSQLFEPMRAVYNPLTLATWLTNAVNCSTQRTLQRDDVFFHWDAPSSLWGKSEEDLLEKTTALASTLQENLKSSKVLLLTLGTAQVHFLRSDGNPVGNNHKQAETLFNSRMLTVQEIVASLESIAEYLRNLCPQLAVVITVSPVRHTKTGLPRNALSKATLLLAAHQVCANNGNWHYFPAFEILTDDLRDYRFYASDALHPSQEAEAYIFAHFANTFLSEQCIQQVLTFQKQQKFLNHRPLVPFGKAFDEWVAKTASLKKPR